MAGDGASGALVAVSAARSAGPGAVSTSSVSTHTRKVGLIYPPPDIRTIADRTAAFVVKNGPEFEKLIRAREAGKSKFAFLQPTDPYHAYYLHVLAEKRGEADGRGDEGGGEAAAGVAPAAAPAAAPPARPSPTEPPAAVAPVVALTEPEAARYTALVPEGLSPLEVDTIKLAAAFAARNGKSFLEVVLEREVGQQSFAFLRSTHSLHGFFTQLVEAYGRVLLPPRGLVESLREDAADPTRLLRRALNRLEWERTRRAEARRAEDAREAERVATLSIDWHDFVVVETIDFLSEEEDALPPPATARELRRATRARRDELGLEGGREDDDDEGDDEGAGRAGRSGRGGPRARPMDAEEAALVAQGREAERAERAAEAGGAGGAGGGGGGGGEGSRGGPEAVREAEAGRPGAVGEGGAGRRGAEDDGDGEERGSDGVEGEEGGEDGEGEGDDDNDDDDESEPVLVLKGIKRRRPTAAAAAHSDFAVSPITGELVPLAGMAEHMRVALLDPRWAAQRDAALAKLRGSSRASDEEVASNLGFLARTRPDVFGGRGEGLAAAVREAVAEARAAGKGPAGAPEPQAPAGPAAPEPAAKKVKAGQAPPQAAAERAPSAAGPSLPLPAEAGAAPSSLPPAPSSPAPPPVPAKPLSEEAFAALHSAPYALSVRVDVPSSAAHGQTLAVPTPGAQLDLAALRATLGGVIGLPAPRLALRRDGEDAPLAESATLAAHALGPGARLVVSRKDA